MEPATKHLHVVKQTGLVSAFQRFDWPGTEMNLFLGIVIGPASRQMSLKIKQM